MIMKRIQQRALINMFQRRFPSAFHPSSAIRICHFSLESADPMEMKEEVKEMKLRPRVQTAFDMILKLNKLQVAELTYAIQEKMGISDQAFVVSSSPTQGGEASGTEEAKEEKTIFDVKLTGFDAKSKIKVIKEIRTLTGLGLKEAKELVESSPGVVKKDLKKEDAEAIILKLKECGATAEME